MNEQGTTAAAATEVSFVICFAAGTPVMTPQGPKPIEELQQGDLVLARDENNVEGELQPKRVEKVFRREGETLELRIRGQVIRTTDTHPFFVRGKGWTPAGELRPRDLLSTDKGDWVEVDAVRPTGESEPVYNLRVADFHTYFVGRKEWQFAVWVHNSCGGEPEFFANRPFHLFIRDNITSTIAFMGRIDDPTQLQNDVAPVVVQPNADFDGNTKVDGADFLAWQRGLGATGGANGSAGDSNADGDVDSSDLAVWKTSFTAPAARNTFRPGARQDYFDVAAAQSLAIQGTSARASSTAAQSALLLKNATRPAYRPELHDAAFTVLLHVSPDEGRMEATESESNSQQDLSVLDNLLADWHAIDVELS
jgi:hypothetical protein